jgi:hypothetical protein
MALIAGCNNSEPQPSQSTTPTPTPTEATVSVYYVADTPLGMKLFEETRTLQTLGDAAIESVTQLVDGTLAPLDPDYTNLWSNGSAVASITQNGEVATVDFSAVHLNVGAAGEMAAINQIVWTLTANNSTITGVIFEINGDPVESLAGHVDTTGVLTRGDGFEVLSAVNILHPAEGSNEAGDVVITGLACTFEANVAWELRKDGKRVDGGSTLAAEACPVTAAWEVELGLLDAGTYVFKAMEFSAKDGGLSALDTKTFVVD